MGPSPHRPWSSRGVGRPRPGPVAPRAVGTGPGPRRAARRPGLRAGLRAPLVQERRRRKRSRPNGAAPAARRPAPVVGAPRPRGRRALEGSADRVHSGRSSPLTAGPWTDRPARASGDGGADGEAARPLLRWRLARALRRRSGSRAAPSASAARACASARSLGGGSASLARRRLRRAGGGDSPTHHAIISVCPAAEPGRRRSASGRRALAPTLPSPRSLHAPGA